jgi:hypothetical protein
VHGALSPLPDGKGDVFADLSRQAWFVKIPFSLGALCPIDQPEERKSVMLELPSDGINETESEPLSMDYHRG